jgi:AcrR family transcriptional regulator
MTSADGRSSQPPEASKRKRIRNPDAHRAAILASARSVFAEHGYANGTIREIARRAGVTHGLVVRHFSTKEQLFVRALMEQRAEKPYSGPVAGLPEYIAARYVENIENDGAGDPFVALLRSAGDTPLAKELLKTMRGEPATTLLGVLPAQDLDRRADLLGALLIGVTFSRYILAEGTLATMTPPELIAYLTQAISGILLDSP